MKSTENTADKAADKTTEKAAELVTDKATDKAAEPAGDKGTDKAADKPELTGIYRNQAGSVMGIGTAVTMGFVFRGSEKDTVVIRGTTYKAKLAVEAGFIDDEAAAYIAALPGTDKHAPFTITHAEPPKEEKKATAPQAVVAALGAFFTQPTALSKQVAVEALEEHLKAAAVNPA